MSEVLDKWVEEVAWFGDYVQLRENYRGYNNAWLKVEDVEAYDILLLDNGLRVPNSEKYIREVITREGDTKWLGR